VITLSVKHNFPEVQRRLRELSSDIKDKAIAAALNKTADKAKTAAVRAIAQEYNLTQSYARKHVEILKASAKQGRLSIVLYAFGSGGPRGQREGRAMNVIGFGARAVKPRKIETITVRTKGGGTHLRKVRTGGGVSIKIKRGGPRKLLDKAFIVTANGGTFVAQRSKEGTKTGKLGKRSIFSVMTIDVPQMFNSRKINYQIRAKIAQEFPIEFDRAARLYLERFARA
jgi:hypothetical protein